MSRKTRFGLRDDDGGERVVAVARGARVVALVLQDPGHQIADVGLVIDNENICGHAHYPFTLFCFSGSDASAWPAAANRTRTQAPR